MNTWFISDTHFGHANILKFLKNDGTPLRPNFSSIEEHDETIIQNWNKVVKPEDKVYHLGDVAMDKKYVKLIGRCNGRKTLIAGNHDIFITRSYTQYFDNVRACRHLPQHGLIFSHIPVHPNQLERRFKANVHGHLHANKVLWDQNAFPDRGEDERYLNICVEHTNYTPISLDEILEKLKNA